MLATDAGTVGWTGGSDDGTARRRSELCGLSLCLPPPRKFTLSPSSQRGSLVASPAGCWARRWCMARVNQPTNTIFRLYRICTDAKRWLISMWRSFQYILGGVFLNRVLSAMLPYLDERLACVLETIGIGKEMGRARIPEKVRIGLNEKFFSAWGTEKEYLREKGKWEREFGFVQRYT